MAVVREKGYTHWDGRLAERRFPWLPITRTGIRLAFRKRGFKFVFAGAFLPAFVALGGLYVSERLEDFKALVQSNRALLKIDPNYFKLFLTNQSALFWLVLVLVFAGRRAHRRGPQAQLPPALLRPAARQEGLHRRQDVGRRLLRHPPDGAAVAPPRRLQAHLRRELRLPPRLPLAPLVHPRLFGPPDGVLRVLRPPPVGLEPEHPLRHRPHLRRLLLLRHPLRDPPGISSGPPTCRCSPFRTTSARPARPSSAQKLPLAVPAVWSFLVLAGICLLAAAVLNRKIRSVEVIK